MKTNSAPAFMRREDYPPTFHFRAARSTPANPIRQPVPPVRDEMSAERDPSRSLCCASRASNRLASGTCPGAGQVRDTGNQLRDSANAAGQLELVVPQLGCVVSVSRNGGA